MQGKFSTYSKFDICEYTVTGINAAIKNLFEDRFKVIIVRGEISDIKKSSAGNVFFTLKDEVSFLNVMCLKSLLPFVGNKIVERLDVLVTGKLVLQRSNCILKVTSISKKGYGGILQAIEDRKEKLNKEGIFDSSHKLPIPNSININSVGVITSKEGAVLHDIMQRISQRFPKKILVYDAPVQGNNAEYCIAKGIAVFCSLPLRRKPDVIIIARGGGSLEDLMPFNGEMLSIAAYNASIPIISAIGHEIDNTILDLSVDKRASTPTAAAEIVTSPTIIELRNYFGNFSNRIADIFNSAILHSKNELTLLKKVLKSKGAILNYNLQLQLSSSKLTNLFINHVNTIAVFVAKQEQKILSYQTAQSVSFQQNLKLEASLLCKAQNNATNAKESSFFSIKVVWRSVMRMLWQKCTLLLLVLSNNFNLLQSSSQNYLQSVASNLFSKHVSLKKSTVNLLANFVNKLQHTVQRYNDTKLFYLAMQIISDRQNSLKLLHHRLNQASLQNALCRGFATVTTHNNNKSNNGARVLLAKDINIDSSYNLHFKDGKVTVNKADQN
ncbi:MAG: exodeoxyribonuclease VII large subunit [Alphaproteobacteria bacterium]|nr:exodeoxyribonuclease VII large subunit [Rickettsiales bacterium]